MLFLCLADKLLTEVFDYRLVKWNTLADGIEKCNFNLTKRGAVDVYSTVWNDRCNNAN